MEALVLYNLVALIIGAIAAWSVAFVYMYLHRGWKDNTFAKMLIPSLLSKGALFTWLAIARLLPQGEYRGWVSTGLFTVLVAVMVWRAYMYFKEELALSRETRNGLAEEPVTDT